MLTIRIETTTDAISPAGAAITLPRGGDQDLALEFLTSGVLALRTGETVGIELYAPDDLVTPIYSTTAFSEDAPNKRHTGVVDTHHAALAWRADGTLWGRVTWDGGNEESDLFHVEYGGVGGLPGAPEPYGPGNPVPVTAGGTGATDAATARANLGVNRAGLGILEGTVTVAAEAREATITFGSTFAAAPKVYAQLVDDDDDYAVEVTVKDETTTQATVRLGASNPVGKTLTVNWLAVGTLA